MSRNIVTGLLSIFFCLIPTENFSQEKIKIVTESQGYNNHFNLSEFYFVHNIFADAFFMTDLYKQLDYDEMTYIIKEILYKISPENNVLLRIQQQEGPEARLLFYFIEGTKDGTILVMQTNFHSENRMFTEKIDENKSITRWYFVRDDKIVYRKNLFSEETEKEKLSQKPHTIIGYYLFDDNPENDSKIYNLIENILEDDKFDEVSKLYAKMYLGEYYLMQSNFEKAEKTVKSLSSYFEEYKDNGIPNQYSLIVNMAETEFQILTRLKN